MHGSNALPPPKLESFWSKLKENYDDPLIRILLLALGVTMVLALFGFADFVEGLGIAVAVFLATFVSTYSEYRNESSFQDLQQEASLVEVSVFRSGEAARVSIADLVRGDYVLLQSGAAVPADGLLIAGALDVCQQSLTGEADEVRKTAVATGLATVLTDDAADSPASTSEPHRVFRGSMVKGGEGLLLVQAVGVRTLYGAIADELAVDTGRLAPLQIKLSSLADGIARLGYLGAGFIASSFLFKQVFIDNGFSLDRIGAYLFNWHIALHDAVTALILAIIIIVVAVPEGLPMMIAIVLSLNMRKLLGHHVLVRRLIGIETAGSMDLLFADKTGTITEGVFTPRVFLSGAARGYPAFTDIPKPLRGVLGFCLRESSSATVNSSSSSVAIVGGNPTDRALLRYLDTSTLLARESMHAHAPPAVAEGEVVFSSVHKFSALQASVSEAALRAVFGLGSSNGRSVSMVLLKGAPEVLLDKCVAAYAADGGAEALTEAALAHLVATMDALAAQGARLIAVATGTVPISAFRTDGDGYTVPEGLVLVGVIALTDVVRAQAREAVATAHAAGVQVVMITGDRLETAKGVAAEIGLLGDASAWADAAAANEGPSRGASSQYQTLLTRRGWQQQPQVQQAQAQARFRLARKGSNDEEAARPEAGASNGALSASGPALVLTSRQLAELSDAELSAVIPRLRVIARALPSDKSRLVAVAQVSGPHGRVVGMTGDGVNDTAALNRADVSFAMGAGSEVAKEASDIVILNNDIYAVVSAMLYGRTIFKSIRKFVVFQSTINLAATVIVFLGPFLGFDFPLTLIQLLWVNIVMDSLAALAFGGEPALARYLHEAPISRAAPIFNPKMWLSVLANGLFIALYSVVFLSSRSIHALFSREVPGIDVAAGARGHSGSSEVDTAKVQSPSEIAMAGGAVFHTAFFSFFVFICTLNGLNVRTDRTDLLDSLLDNKGFIAVIALIFGTQMLFTVIGGSVLRVVPLTLHEWTLLLAMSALILPFDMARKAISRRVLARTAPHWLDD